jgi:hypothetical protein
VTALVLYGGWRGGDVSGIRVIRAGVKEGERSFVGRLFEVENAVLAFFDEEGSLKLGTLTIAMPQFEGRTCLSSVILGERNVLVTKLLAEQLARAFQKIALVSTHLVEIEARQTSASLLRLAASLCEKARAK